ncbi:YggS family pyridoxal phosphate-dependent enzyme [Candidatus Poribacteria bacterium]|nr:MAG: YggS family pyridoxal phosphate-dependent enzyme [Candidatus Poribacteria bacterium]
MNSIVNNLFSINERIARAAERSNRTPDSIELVAVTKGRSVPEIHAALAAGATNIGENRVQEAQQKYAAVNSVVDAVRSVPRSETCRWHLVGHLQRNKVKAALDMFSLIHSVDSLRLLAEIARRSEKQARRIDVLIQVNTTRETSKYGLNAEDLLAFMADAQAYPTANIIGLMTMGQLNPSPDANRPAFALLRSLAAKVEAEGFPGVTMQYLSMGMTNDFEVAIEEGANLVRIGRAIFESSEE